MEVTFRMTWQDRLAGYKAGLTRMTLPYRLIWGGFLLLIIAGLGLISWSRGNLTTFPSATLLRRSLVLDFGFFSAIVAVYALMAVAGWCLTKRRTVELRHNRLVCRFWFGRNAIRWLAVSDIIVTGEHICFCQNAPTAVVVPRMAFADPEQAQAFLEQAEHYWRRATGRRDPSPPDTAGVWPPAPNRWDSQAPSDSPEQ